MTNEIEIQIDILNIYIAVIRQVINYIKKFPYSLLTIRLTIGPIEELTFFLHFFKKTKKHIVFYYRIDRLKSITQ